MMLPILHTDNALEATFAAVHRRVPTRLSELSSMESSLMDPQESIWASDREYKHWHDDQLASSLQHPALEITKEHPVHHEALKAEPSPSVFAPQEDDNATRVGWACLILHAYGVILSSTLGAFKKAMSLFAHLTPFAVVVWFILCAAFQVPHIPEVIVTPLCDINILSRTYFCVKTYRHNFEPIYAEAERRLEQAQWADYPGLVMVQNVLADTFAGDTFGASKMAHQITQAELATGDRIAAIRYSTLKTAKHLVDSLRTFIQDAVDAGDSLEELDAKAMGAIDSMVGINTWALQAIEEVKFAIPGVMNSPAVCRIQKSTTEVIDEKFNEAMTVQSAILSGLVVYAKYPQRQLERMKERLQVIRDLANRENILINAEQDELLASMWTKLGSNRRDLQRFATNLDLLEDLESYTDKAKIHISQALSNLMMMQSQMKDLRNKVSQPDIAGTSIPVDVHIRTILDGIHRMKEGMIRAREREGDIIRIIGAQ